MAARRSVVVCALAQLWATSSDAQSPQSLPADAAQLNRVEVTGSEDAIRSASTVSRTVISREELVKYADPTLADALRRVPGITVSGSAATGLEVRMRGLGGGYTQILINGEPMARGFALDSLAPDLVERIEVMRGASADSSTQGIAGTINVVLRRTAKPGEVETKITASTTEGLGSGVLFLQGARKFDDVTLSLGANVNLERERWLSTGTSTAVSNSGLMLHQRESSSVEDTRHFTTSLTPRLSWKPKENQSLTVDGLFQRQDFDYSAAGTIGTLQGPAPDFPNAYVRSNLDWQQSRLSLNLKTPVPLGGRVELQSTGVDNERTSGSDFIGATGAAQPILTRRVDARVRDTSRSLLAKYSREFVQGHKTSVGLDGQATRRSERRLQTESSLVGYPTVDLDESYSASVERLAFFAQDEMELMPGVSLYMGLRSESLRTNTRGNSIATTGNRSRVLSPIAQLLWDIKEDGSEQARVGLSRTYKPPTARELVPRRLVAPNNSPTTPNFQGNPDLLPELAWGLDASYEISSPSKGSLSLSAYLRRIDNVILEQVFLTDNTWVSMPANSGRADVWGVELDSRLQLRSLFKSAPNLEVRFGLARNESRVRELPGPGNRLARQPAMTGTFGADWRLATAPVTLGASMAYERGELFRNSLVAGGHGATKRNIDVQAIWSIDKTTKLRVSLNNAYAPSQTSLATYRDDFFSQNEYTTVAQFRVLRIQFESKF